MPGNEIHARLAADRGIHLREHGGRNLHQLDAAHVERCEQSADVADHSAAQRDHHRFAVGAQLCQFFREGLDSRQSLGRFAVRHEQHLRSKSAGLEDVINFDPQRFRTGGTVSTKILLA